MATLSVITASGFHEATCYQFSQTIHLAYFCDDWLDCWPAHLVEHLTCMQLFAGSRRHNSSPLSCTGRFGTFILHSLRKWQNNKLVPVGERQELTV